MRGHPSLGLTATAAAVWATCMLQVLATEGFATPLEVREVAHVDIDAVLARGPVSIVLNEREAAQADAAATFLGMSDEQLMEGTDKSNAYHQEFHPCPISCADQLPQNWTVYTDIDRLAQCKEPMLFDFNIYNQVANPETPTKLRVCNAGDGDASKPRLALLNETTKGFATRATPANLTTNPTNSGKACVVGSSETTATFQLSEQGPNVGKDAAVVMALSQLEHFFQTAECESKLMFSSVDSVVAGLYIGSSMGHGTVSAAVKGLLDSIKTGGASQTIVSQLCGEQRPAAHTFGIAISTTGNVTAVQNAVKSWNDGGCETSLESTNELTGITISESPLELIGNGTLTNSTSGNGTIADVLRRGVTRLRNVARAPLAPRGMCTTRTVESGDSCGKLATKCGISASDFTKYNPDSELCSGLQPGQLVCCSAGGMDDLIPKIGADGICATYHVVQGDNCGAIAGKHAIKIKDIEKYNNKTTWGWYGCDGLMVDMNICLSEGKRPMPYPNKDALCGPTKPGSDTTYIENDNDLTNLNPCPLNACCNVWGQCGINGDFCIKKASPLRNPGTSALKNGCVSNCGTNIISSSSPPAQYGRVGYYETWNFNRDCLWMRADHANPGGLYTHIHWAFAAVNMNDYTVSINDTFKQWADFKALPLKRIISFGGWGYSTEPATYDNLRQAMSPDHRDAFAANVAKFLNDEGLDGADFDWEYPGAIDIPGTPPGSIDDGPNYLKFLTVMRQKMPSGKTLSIAAPASYWYLKSFPIEKMSKLLDYIVYMTYDLHGQWDAGNIYSIDGCPAGNCLRSHVNMTETKNVLSMITKAKVESNKIYVGESSYGRSFKMAQAGCKGPMCTFLGDRLNSQAAKGECTATAGYISNAEISNLIDMQDYKIDSWYDKDSDSDMLVYDNTEWVAYMSQITKDRRRGEWQGLNFGGTIDWAVDLQDFTTDDWEGFDEGDDGEEEFPPPLPPCTGSYDTIDAIEKDVANIGWWCKDQYIIHVLKGIQAKALTDYDSLISKGYDNKFNRYADAVAQGGQKHIDTFMHDKGNTYFTCDVVESYVCCEACNALTPRDKDSYCRYCEDYDCNYSSSCNRNNPNNICPALTTRYKNITGPCSPDFSLRSAPGEPATGFDNSVYWHMRPGKEDDFYADLMLDSGISKDNIKFAPSFRFLGVECIPPSSKHCGDTDFFYNYPTTSDYNRDDIPNPKDIIGKAYNGMKGMGPELDLVDQMVTALAYNGPAADMVDSVSLPVVMMQDAVKQMADIAETVDKWDEEKRKSIILAFLTAIFFFIPIAGEVAGAFMTGAMVARIAASVGIAGELAVDIYGVVKDKDNLPLAILGIVLAPLGLVDIAQVAKAAVFRRAMKAEDVGKLGKRVSDPMESIARIKGNKCLLPAPKKKRTTVEIFPVGGLPMSSLTGRDMIGYGGGWT